MEMTAPIEISDSALVEVKNIFKNKGIPSEYGLRVTVRGAGCGVALKLGFDKEKTGDEMYTFDEVKVFIQKKEMMFIIGKKIEFYDEQDGRGFVFV